MIVEDISAWALRSGSGYCARYRTGIVVLSNEKDKEVVFDTPINDGNYTVLWERGGDKIASLWVTDKSMSGFVVHASLKLSEVLRYFVIHN